MDRQGGMHDTDTDGRTACRSDANRSGFVARPEGAGPGTEYRLGEPAKGLRTCPVERKAARAARGVWRRERPFEWERKPQNYRKMPLAYRCDGAGQVEPGRRCGRSFGPERVSCRPGTLHAYDARAKIVPISACGVVRSKAGLPCSRTCPWSSIEQKALAVDFETLPVVQIVPAHVTLRVKAELRREGVGLG